jgi:hypothetical protein
MLHKFEYAVNDVYIYIYIVKELSKASINDGFAIQ